MRQRRVSPVTIDGLRVGPFQVEFAAALEERDDEFRLRHHVFVEERRYLEVAAGGREVDELDPYCVALLIRDAASGEAAACQRFVLPERLPAPLRTQVERVAEVNGLPLAYEAPHRWAEVSRTTVAPGYRWGASGAGVPAMRVITLASLALARSCGRDTLFSLSDKRTALLMKRRVGFVIHQLGDEFDYHGRRVLFRIRPADVEASLSSEMRAIVNALTPLAFAAAVT